MKLDANSKKPPIAISMGDPAGIGPEIIIKAWKRRNERALAPFFVLGCSDVLKKLEANLPIKLIKKPDEANKIFNTYLPVIDIKTKSEVFFGKADSKNAPMILEAIEQAVGFVRSGKASALVTAPINKHSLYDAGFNFKGHTDFLAHLCDQDEDDAVMFFYSEKLCVSPLTIHMPLAQVAKAISKEKIIKSAKTILSELDARFGFSSPRLGICGLNPHAGEYGNMGDEEIKIISPAVDELKADGHAVFGPFAADSLFSEGERRKYDAILAMYHDQALAPFKALDMRKGVNITLGLKNLIRLSPDHGTAYEIAGVGVADAESIIQAIILGSRLANKND